MGREQQREKPGETARDSSRQHDQRLCWPVEERTKTARAGLGPRREAEQVIGHHPAVQTRGRETAVMQARGGGYEAYTGQTRRTWARSTLPTCRTARRHFELARISRSATSDCGTSTNNAPTTQDWRWTCHGGARNPCNNNNSDGNKEDRTFYS